MRVTCLLLALCAVAGAQTFNARITGTITDPSGAPVPGATVTAVQVSTNASRKAGTNESGVYDVPLLLPGTYEVKIDAPGFQSQVRKDVELGLNQTATLDFSLGVAQVTTAVDVTAEVPLLQSETSSVAGTLDTKTIEDFPLQQRDVMSLVRSMPGVAAKSQVGDARGGRNVFDSNFSVGGGRTSTNEVLLDGAANTIGDFNGVVVVPPPDSVQEFRVETNSFSAEFGRTGGGAVNIVTKAGTNAYHGTSYYYHQNDAFNANSFSNNRFGTPKSILRRHQYGFTLGGPVWIPKMYKGTNKTFFFAAFEGRREKDPVNLVTSVPTALERAGDFSKTVFLSGSTPTQIRIYDPFTSRVVNGARTRDQFPGNVIPASRINPVSKNFVGQYPQPNREGSPVTGRNNYLFSDRRSYSRDIFTIRVDQFVSEKHRIFGRISSQENADTQPSKFVRFTNSNSLHDTFGNAALDDTYQISPSVNNVLRYSYARFHARQIPNVLGFDPTQLGLPDYIRANANVLFFPNVDYGSNAGDFASLGGTAYNDQPRDTQGVQDNIVWVKGRHNLRIGGEYRLYRFYPFQVFNPTGSYSFSKNFTAIDQQAAARPELGFGFASMLLGTGNFSYEHVEPLTGIHHYMGAYVQDDFKVNQRLTLNLGLRWETETGTEEAHDRISYFDPNYAAPIPAKPKGAMLFAGNGNPRTIRAANLANFGPRVGLAYRTTPKTAIRAGYGIFYLPLGLEPTITTTPYNYTLSADVVDPAGMPKTTLSDPFVGGIQKPASAVPPADGSYRLGTNNNIVLRDQLPGYMQQWNFAIGRQIARTTVVDVTYYGSRGVHLPIPSMELNQIDPKVLANGGAYLNQLVPNPYFGQFSSGLLAQRMIPRMQLLKPFPQFANPSTANAYGGSLAYYRPPVGDSIYHAVTFRYERRFMKGFSLAAHYTISKLIDTGGVGNGNAFNDPSALRDIYNTRLERSVGSFDIPQRLVIYYGVDIPFGKGKKFLNTGGLTNRIAGGWRVFAFHTYQKGLPVAIGGPDTSRIAGAGPSRASVVAGQDPRLPYETSIANARDFNPNCGCTKPWINTAAFYTTPEFQIPNGPRFLPNVREGNLRQVDMTLSKSLAITEKIRASLQGRAFNVFNQVTFAGPSITTVNSANFGSAGGTLDNARRLEVGAKITF